MSNISDAADALIGLAEKLKPITDVANVLKELGSVETALVERKAALAKAKAEHEDKLGELERSQTAIADANAAAADILDAAKTKADQIVQEAESEAADALAAAQKDAADIVQKARDEAARIEIAHHERMEAAGKTLAETRARLDDMTAKVQARQAEHDALSDKIEAMKQHAKSVLGPAETT